MRNLIIFGLIIFLMVMVQFVHAQTIDDVIEKYITAMGGKEKMMSLTSLRMTGNLSVMGNDVSIVVTRKHMVGSRIDLSIMGIDNYQLVTPSKGWVFMPIQGQSAPEEMGEDLFKSGQNQLDIQGAFINYREKGTTIIMAGKESLDGTECYKLKVNFKNGSNVDYYIDTKSNRIFKTGTKMMVNGEETEIINTFSDYKLNEGGFWFAYTNSNSRGESIYDKIETNIAVDENIFKY